MAGRGGEGRDGLEGVYYWAALGAVSQSPRRGVRERGAGGYCRNDYS